MTWLILLLWINFVVSQTSKDVPVEVSEDGDMLSSLEELISQAKVADVEAKDSPKAEARMSLFDEFPKPKMIRSLSDSFAMNFLNYAATAYCPQNEIQNWNCYNCQGYGKNTKDVVYISYDKHKSAAYMGVNHERKIIIVSYRGTSNFKNWLVNLKFKFTRLQTNDTSPIEVHSGFSEAADALMPRIRSSILMAKKNNPKYKIVFTGHSLGGALATLAAVKLAEERIIDWKDIQIVTFGQPRVGNTQFANYLDSKPIESARVTTRGDIVSISPGKFLNYCHSQHIIHMNMNGKPVQCSKTEEDPRCVDYVAELTLDAHFTFWNQRLNSNCKDPKTTDPRNWFQKAKDDTVGWFKKAKDDTVGWFKKAKDGTVKWFKNIWPN